MKKRAAREEEEEEKRVGSGSWSTSAAAIGNVPRDPKDPLTHLLKRCPTIKPPALQKRRRR